MNFGASIFPVDAVTTVTGGITSALTDNIAVVLGIFAFMVALQLILRMVNRAKNGRV